MHKNHISYPAAERLAVAFAQQEPELVTNEPHNR